MGCWNALLVNNLALQWKRNQFSGSGSMAERNLKTGGANRRGIIRGSLGWQGREEGV